jgi:hypothetical protein
MVILYAFAASWGITGQWKMRRSKRILLFAGVFAAVQVPIWILSGAGSYSHVFSLLATKVRFLGQAPADPSRIDFDVRALWTGPFESPSPVTICTAFFLPVLLALYPGYRLIVRREENGGTEPCEGRNGMDGFGRKSFLWMAIAFLPQYLLVTRLEVFFIVFLSVIAGGLWIWIPRPARIALPVLLLFMGSEAWRYSEGTRQGNAWRRILPESAKGMRTVRDPSVSSVFRLIEDVTDSTDVILARYPISPMILAYTGRPVVVHAIFESAENRRRIAQVTATAFGTEPKYHALCRDLGVDFVLYEANTLFDESPGFDRYMSASFEIPPASPVYRMHFFPTHLERFRLAGQTQYFRLYRVLKADDREESSSGGSHRADGLQPGLGRVPHRTIHGSRPNPSTGRQCDASPSGSTIPGVPRLHSTWKPILSASSV